MNVRLTVLGCFVALNHQVAMATELDDIRDLKGKIADALDAGYSIEAVCGSSTGKVIFQDDLEKGWQDDAIGGGRIVFLRGPNVVDILFIDTTGRMLSATEDGGLVAEIYTNPDRGELVWFFAYARTGVTEAYSLNKGNPAYVFWSANKPSVDYPSKPPRTIGPKVSSFIARCI